MSEFPNNNYRKSSSFKVKRISLLNNNKIAKINTGHSKSIIESKKMISNQRKLTIVVEKPVFIDKKIEIIANPETINRSIVNATIRKVYKHSENKELRRKIRNNEEKLKLLIEKNENLFLNKKKLEKQKNCKIVVKKYITKKEVLEKGTQLFKDEERKIKMMERKLRELEFILNQKKKESENLKRDLIQKNDLTKDSDKKRIINNSLKEKNYNLALKIEEKKKQLENFKKKNQEKKKFQTTDKEILNTKFLKQDIENIKNNIQKISSEKQTQKKLNNQKEKIKKEKQILLEKLTILKETNEELINKIENQNEKEKENRNNFLIIEEENTNNINEKGSIKSLDTNINDDLDSEENNVKNEHYEKLIKNNILVMEEKLEISVKKLEMTKIMKEKLVREFGSISIRLICVLSELERLKQKEIVE